MILICFEFRPVRFQQSVRHPENIFRHVSTLSTSNWRWEPMRSQIWRLTKQPARTSSVSVTEKQTSVSLPLTFFCTTSCQLMVMKNLWVITSLASSGPPPNLSAQTTSCKRVFPKKEQTQAQASVRSRTSVWGPSWAGRPAGTWPQATGS